MGLVIEHMEDQPSEIPSVFIPVRIQVNKVFIQIFRLHLIGEPGDPAIERVPHGDEVFDRIGDRFVELYVSFEYRIFDEVELP